MISLYLCVYIHRQRGTPVLLISFSPLSRFEEILITVLREKPCFLIDISISPYFNRAILQVSLKRRERKTESDIASDLVAITINRSSSTCTYYVNMSINRNDDGSYVDNDVF